jgi:subtilisin family serine protease
LDSRGQGRISTIVTGLQWAIDHQLQVLNMSYGAAQGSQTEQRIIEACGRAGIVLVAAAGNEAAPVDYPAAYPQVIAVGAVDKAGKVAPFSNHGAALAVVAPGVSILSSVPKALGYPFVLARRDEDNAELDATSMRNSGATSAEGIVGPVQYAGRGTTSDVAAVDLKGAIALIERGDLTFSEKVANATAAGAIGVLIYNNVPGSFAGMLASQGTVPVLSISNEDGLPLKDASGAKVRVYVEPHSIYTRFAGTSMASPHVAGVAALILSVRPDLDPDGVRKILVETATDLGPAGRDDNYGDGLVNATAAVKAARGLPSAS